MADISKTTGVKASYADLEPMPWQTIGGIQCGEAIASGDVCYIKNSDNMIYRSVGTAANAAAKARGMCMLDTPQYEVCTIVHHIAIRYGNGLAAGGNIFVGAAAGAIADAATTGGSAAIGFMIDDEVLYFEGSSY